MTKIFTQTPRAPVSAQTRQAMWQELNPLFQTELSQAYYQHLYRAANGTEYEDIYQLVQHNLIHHLRRRIKQIHLLPFAWRHHWRSNWLMLGA